MVCRPTLKLVDTTVTREEGKRLPPIELLAQLKNNIGSVLLNLINMIKHVTEKRKNAIILLIDFKKAFDSIDHVFMHNTLSLLGFPIFPQS